MKYDLQIFADRIEFCWIHLRGISALENSLWGYDGHGIRVWLNALAIETQTSDPNNVPQSVKESVNIPLDFYPLCKLEVSPEKIHAVHMGSNSSRSYGQGNYYWS